MHSCVFIALTPLYTALPSHTHTLPSQDLSSKRASAAAAALTEHALGWASANGLSVGVVDPAGLFTTTHLPFSLMPNALPRSEFERICLERGGGRDAAGDGATAEC